MIYTSTLEFTNSSTQLTQEVPCGLALTRNAGGSNIQVGKNQWVNFVINFNTSDIEPFRVPSHMHLSLQKLITYCSAIFALTGNIIPYNNNHPDSLTIFPKTLQNRTLISLEENKQTLANKFFLPKEKIHIIQRDRILNFILKNTPPELYNKFANNPTLIGKNVLLASKSLEEQIQFIQTISITNPELGSNLRELFNSNTSCDIYGILKSNSVVYI